MKKDWCPFIKDLCRKTPCMLFIEGESCALNPKPLVKIEEEEEDKTMKKCPIIQKPCWIGCAWWKESSCVINPTPKPYIKAEEEKVREEKIVSPPQFIPQLKSNIEILLDEKTSWEKAELKYKLYPLIDTTLTQTDMESKLSLVEESPF